MSMMSSGFGWRRESPMNVQSALSTLFLKSWVLEDHPMGMGTMRVITDSALRVSFRNKNYGDDERVSVCTLLSKTCKFFGSVSPALFVFMAIFLCSVFVSTFPCSI
ncbi:hypothetical protein SAY87_012282 [Trapa incisa]|uniref:Uncharacterized protein n=1 Tax=Trapa incisa TaxID=236973 RepID=A0AAN7GH16_9MYRT|nr:hypothetical protein SAY87_012282 [Trapa incisa]